MSSELEEQMKKLEQLRAEQNNLILSIEKAVNEKVDEVSSEWKEGSLTLKEDIINISKYKTKK